VEPLGTGWSSNGVQTTDRTLRRKCGILTGDPDGSDPFAPSIEWDSFPQDTFSDLGSRSCP
jgi:hypothetical protein